MKNVYLLITTIALVAINYSASAATPKSSATPVINPMPVTLSFHADIQKYGISPQNLREDSRRTKTFGIQHFKSYSCCIKSGYNKGGRLIANKYRHNEFHCYIISKNSSSMIPVSGYFFDVMERIVEHRELEAKQDGENKKEMQKRFALHKTLPLP